MLYEVITERAAQVIAGSAPDIVALQDVAAGGDQLRQLGDELGMRSFGGPGGVGLLSYYPLTGVRSYDP